MGDAGSGISSKEQQHEELPPIKQAVVIIHGMGEQRPMDTMRCFVETLFVKDTSISGEENRVWSVPDQKGLSYELRRLSTPVSRANVRTDFFEFYYADLMNGNTLSQLRAWILDLLLRRPEDVPRRMVWPWFVLWLLTLGVVTAFAVTLDVRAYIPFAEAWSSPWELPWYLWAVLGVALIAILYWGEVVGELPDLRALLALVLCLLGGMLVVLIVTHDPTPSQRFAAAAVGVVVSVFSSLALRYFGDVARYVRAAPDTVQARHEIRERGLALLEGLHDGSYDRIVVIAHSLGTIVAYDLLNLLWQKIGPTAGNPPAPGVVTALSGIDEFLPGKSGSFNVEAYRDAQWKVFQALRASRQPKPAKTPWLVSDFITLGSPLTHAEFLVERNQADFLAARSELALPVSPPLPNIVPANVLVSASAKAKRDKESILYTNPQNGVKATHHAAVFAATRWTNIYDPYSWILLGDLISGPVSETGDNPRFGKGIREYKVRMRRSGLISRLLFPRVFTHTLYGQWQSRFDKASEGADFEHIATLRNAVELDALGVSAETPSDHAKPKRTALAR